MVYRLLIRNSYQYLLEKKEKKNRKNTNIFSSLLASQEKFRLKAESWESDCLSYILFELPTKQISKLL